MMIYQPIKSGCKKNNSLADMVETVIFDQMYPHSVTLNLKTANQTSCMTLWPTMLHHHTKFGYRRFSSWWDIVQMISSKPPNILFPNLVLWCIIMSRSVMQKDWFAVFKFRVTVRAHLIRYDCFYHVCWTADLFATKFNWMVHHHKLECFV